MTHPFLFHKGLFQGNNPVPARRFLSRWGWPVLLCCIPVACLGVHSNHAEAQTAETHLALTVAETEPGAEADAPADSLPNAPKPMKYEASGAADALKDSSATTNTKTGNEDERQPQTKRILGLMPNFRSVSTDGKLPPQSVKEKFVTATEDSFDYSSLFVPLLLTAYNMGTDATPEFHQGAAGFGRYFWHVAVDQTSENYMVEFVVPSITHEDTRYYTLGRGRFMKRAVYALSRTVITRSDSGKEVFNASEVIGAGASSGLSSLYYPSRERSLENTGQAWGLNVGIDGASFVFKEFWPDINHIVFHAAKPNRQ
jgi:hypothetical protein